MGDLDNLDPNRYMKLNIYTRQSGKIVFKDYEILLDAFETKVCTKILKYKYNKIFGAKSWQKPMNRKSSRSSFKKLRSRSNSRNGNSESEQEPASEEKKTEEKQEKVGRFGKFKMFVSDKKQQMKEKKGRSRNVSNPPECEQTPMQSTMASELEKSRQSMMFKRKMSEAEKKDQEIKTIMKLPEVTQELLKRANPNTMDLYQCSFMEGGELEAYARHLHKKLLHIFDQQLLELKRQKTSLE